MSEGQYRSTKQKKDQLALALFSCVHRPDPHDPGGWGLRNPEPKGPGRHTGFISQGRGAPAWQKSGDTMFRVNDPVTASVPVA